MQQVSAGTVGKVVVGLGLGVLIGTFGTVMHRSIQPWGAVLAVVLVLSTAILSRAWGGFSTLMAYGLAMVISVQVLAQTGPGGDVLVPGASPGVARPWLSWVWVAGSVVAVILAAVAPRRWFADTAAPTVGPLAPAEDRGWPALDEPRP